MIRNYYVFGLVVWGLAYILISGSACKPVSFPPEPDVIYTPPLLDASMDGPNENSDEALTTCGKACANMRSFGCEEGGVTPAGSRCYDICKNSGPLLNPQCVAFATSLADLRQKCHVRCSNVK